MKSKIHKFKSQLLKVSKKIFSILVFILLSSKIFAAQFHDSTDCNCTQAATFETNFVALLNFSPNLGFAYFPHKNIGMYLKAEYDYLLWHTLLNSPHNGRFEEFQGYKFYVGIVTKSKLKKHLIWKNYFLLSIAKMQRTDSIQVTNYYGTYKSFNKVSNTYQSLEWNSMLETNISNKMSFQFGLGFNIIASVLQNDYNYRNYLGLGILATNQPIYKPYENINAFKLSGLLLLLKLNYDLEIKK